MLAYYNEIDPIAAEWLRWLIERNLIVPGWVDERSIVDVDAADLAGFSQVHLFAGIGGWSLAARLAEWPDDKPLWTASCPCQPFSVAGKGAGRDDPRHLWPHVLRLASAARPAELVGEQVAGAAGYDWFDGVAADLEGEGYACRAVDIPACAVDAPHIRQRQYWVAVAEMGDTLSAAGKRRTGSLLASETGKRGAGQLDGDFAFRSCNANEGTRGTLANANSGGRAGWPENPEREALGRNAAEWIAGDVANSGRQPRGAGPTDAENRAVGADHYVRNVGDAIGSRLEGQRGNGDTGGGTLAPGSIAPADGRNGTFWSDAEWLTCHDGKARRTQPGLPLLAHGVPARVAAWRGFGNAIVPPLAAEVLKALMETVEFN